MRGETMILRVTSVRARENINLQFPVAISNFQNSAQVGNPSRARSDLTLNSRISSSLGDGKVPESRVYTRPGKEGVHNYKGTVLLFN